MNKMKKILIAVLVTFGIHTQAQVTTVDSSDTVSYYICYNEDNGSSLDLSIGFNNKGRALNVKYKGMNSSMDLICIRVENETPGGPYPVLVKYYNEMYQDKVNGEYRLTHSGNWDYVEYTRGKDSRKFNFTIDHNSNSYSYTPCF
jgi:predicted transcriptional regulator YdeE